MEQLYQITLDLIHHLGYLGLFVVMTLGNLGIPVGTEVIVPVGGALAGQNHLPPFGPIPAWIVVGAVATAAEVLGGFILYSIGYYGGLPFVRRFGKYVFFREHELERVHAFYERYGKKTVFICRFLPFVRGVAAFPAGISQMQKRYFVTYTALGSAIFCFGLALLGDTMGKHVDELIPVLHKFSLVIVGLIVLAAIAVAWRWQARRTARRAAANAAGGTTATR